MVFHGFGKLGCLGTLILGFECIWIGFWRILNEKNYRKWMVSWSSRDLVLASRDLDGAMSQEGSAWGARCDSKGPSRDPHPEA